MSDLRTTQHAVGPEDGARWLQHAHETLAAAGLRVGAARAVVLDVLAGGGGCLRTPQAIIEDVKRTSTSGSSASVYRTLEELDRHGLIRRAVGPDNVARVELEHPEYHHHHFIDLESGQVIPFDDPAIEAAIDGIAQRLGIEVTGHEVLLRGVVRTTPREG